MSKGNIAARDFENGEMFSSIYTIYYWRFAMTGSHVNRPRTWRKRITTDSEDRTIVRDSLRNRNKTSLDLAAELSESFNKQISARTRRRLQEAGLKGCKARKKPWLSEMNKKVRYEWDLKHKTFTEQYWSNIMWSVESNFQIFGTLGVTYVRRWMGEEYKPECVVPTVKHSGGSVTIWGCMSAAGMREMVVCEGRMYSTKCIDVLESALLPSFTTLFGDTNIDGVQLQQDNTPCHKSVRTMTWFWENNIELLDWPAPSPDLNPIEHLWGLLKRKLRRHIINSKEELKDGLRLEWNAITVKNAIIVKSQCSLYQKEFLL